MGETGCSKTGETRRALSRRAAMAFGGGTRHRASIANNGNAAQDVLVRGLAARGAISISAACAGAQRHPRRRAESRQSMRYRAKSASQSTALSTVLALARCCRRIARRRAAPCNGGRDAYIGDSAAPRGVVATAKRAAHIGVSWRRARGAENSCARARRAGCFASSRIRKASSRRGAFALKRTTWRRGISRAYVVRTAYR